MPDVAGSCDVTREPGAAKRPEQPLSTDAPLIKRAGFLSRFWFLLRQAVISAAFDNCFSIAKGAAYSFLFSLFPVVTTLITILIKVRAQAIVHVIARFVMQVAPPGTEELILWRLQQHGSPLSLSVVSIVLAIWAGSGAMMSLLEGFQAAYRIPTGRPFFHQRAVGIFLVFVVAVPLVVASALLIFGDRGETVLVGWIGLLPEGSELSTPVELAWRVGRYVLAFCTTTFVTGLLYYIGTNYLPEPRPRAGKEHVRLLAVWPGAFLATTLWMIATVGFAWYVAHFGHYNLLYGSIGAVIILLLWLYLIACIALIGCEFNAERERLNALASHLNAQ